MSQPEQDSRYGLLVKALAEKTRDGKIRWHQTAAENTYLAAVKGLNTYEVHSNDQGSVQVLKVRDEVGNLAIKHVTKFDPQMSELYELARRSALQMNEKIDRALEVLNSL